MLRKAGLDLCCEIGEQVREIEGVRGLHIMAIGWPAAVPKIVKRLGLYPRPKPAVAELSSAASCFSSRYLGFDWRSVRVVRRRTASFRYRMGGRRLRALPRAALASPPVEPPEPLHGARCQGAESEGMVGSSARETLACSIEPALPYPRR